MRAAAQSKDPMFASSATARARSFYKRRMHWRKLPDRLVELRERMGSFASLRMTALKERSTGLNPT